MECSKARQTKILGITFKGSMESQINILFHFFGLECLKQQYFHRSNLARALDLIHFSNESSLRHDRRKIVSAVLFDAKNLDSKFFYDDLADLIDSDFDLNTKSCL